jgi:hypothetical protein
MYDSLDSLNSLMNHQYVVNAKSITIKIVLGEKKQKKMSHSNKEEGQRHKSKFF